MPLNDYFNFNDATIPTRGKAFSATLRSLFNEVEYGFWLIGRLVGITRGAVNVATTTGAADIYLAEIEGITEYVDFLRMTLRIHEACTGASTLKVNALTTLPIKRQDGTDIQAGDLLEGGLYDFSMDDELSVFILMGLAVDGSGLYGTEIQVVIDGGNATIDLSKGPYFTYTNSENHGFKMINKPAAGKVRTYYVRIVDPAAFAINFAQGSFGEGITAKTVADNEWDFTAGGTDTLIITVYGTSGDAYIDTRYDWGDI